MKNLYMKQKMFSIGEKFSIQNEEGDIVYKVEGSFFKIPKSFKMYDQDYRLVGTVTKEMFKLLPKFKIAVENEPTIRIEKGFTFFKDRYRIISENVEVRGDWLDKNYEIYRDGKSIAKVTQKWIAMTDTFEIKVIDEKYEHLTIMLVAAIDFVKDQQRAATSSASV